jgi:hypothetical protein
VQLLCDADDASRRSPLTTLNGLEPAMHFPGILEGVEFQQIAISVDRSDVFGPPLTTADGAC